MDSVQVCLFVSQFRQVYALGVVEYPTIAGVPYKLVCGGYTSRRFCKQFSLG